jgi:hypothetical protein
MERWITGMKSRAGVQMHCEHELYQPDVCEKYQLNRDDQDAGILRGDLLRRNFSYKHSDFSNQPWPFVHPTRPERKFGCKRGLTQY